MKNYGKLFRNFVVFFIFILVWQLYVSFSDVNQILLPSPINIITNFPQLFQDYTLYIDILYTLIRTIVSFLLAVIVFVPIGLIMGYFSRVYDYSELFVEFFRSIPATALIPVFLLFFGIGEQSKIFLATWTAGLMLLINTIYGVRHIKIIKKKVAQTLGMSNISYLKKIVFPEAMPSIFGGMRIAISLSLIIIIITEIFHGGIGLGSRIIDSQLSYRTLELFDVIIIIGLLGFSLNRLIIFIENRVIFWKGH